jgi:hypothetical protein
MPPRLNSRHSFTLGILDSAAELKLTDRVPYRFRQFADTRQHIVREGDTLHNLAGRYFRSMARPAGLWWVIADFQPEPVVDPTIRLSPGTVVFVPSVRTVIERILDESRRGER